MKNIKVRLKFALGICLAIILALYLSKYRYQLMLIQGASMEPTFHTMQLVLLKKDFDESSINTGDVIAFWCDGLDSVLVKRVVAVPGQRVVVEAGTLLVDGSPSEYYSEGVFEYGGILDEEIILGDEEYIVIGDNVSESKDSRYEEVGVVRKEDVIGVVLNY